MTTDPHAVPNPETPAGHDSVEMPRPTVAPLVLSVGVALLAMGVVSNVAFLVVGLVVFASGAGLWVAHLRPGQGHFHEELAEPARRPQPVTGQPGKVEQLKEGMPGYRVRLPEKVHPISAGIKGGLVGGVAIIVPAMIYGLLSEHHSIWFPVNLLAGMVLPGMENLTDDQLGQFHFGYVVAAIFIHFITSVIIGMIYGVLLPTLPSIPQSMAWAALLAPIVWTGVTYTAMGIVNPGLRSGVSWPWFVLSQFVYGVVMALVVTQATGLPAVVRGVAGGLLGGMLMPLPALLWSLGSGRGVWYPVNLLAGTVLSGHNDPKALEMTQFHADWLILATVMHLAVAVGFGVACALLLPRLRPIPGPFAWGGLVMPILWTGMSYGLMGVVNPVLRREVNWPWFVVSQFIFGVAASVIVVRSEQVYIPPAGTGPDRLSEFMSGQEGRRS
jgi:hypothetical protein